MSTTLQIAREARTDGGGRATLWALAGGLVIGAWVSTLLLALVIVVAVAAGATVASTTTWGRRQLAGYRARRALIARRVARERRLESIGVPREGLLELTTLCDEIERVDGGAASARFDLPDLLDVYADLAITQERCLRALRMASREHLSRAVVGSAEGSPSRQACLQRRLRYWDECRQLADRSAEEMATIAEFVRMIAQRAARPDVTLDGAAIERRIAEVDGDDAALRELDAPDAPRQLAAS